MKFMKKLLMIVVTIMMSSCYSSNKADKQINKAYENYPETVAAFARDKFPCKETGVDTVISTEYDFIEIKCPDSSEQSQVIDTIYLTKPTKPKTYIIYKDKFVEIKSVYSEKNKTWSKGYNYTTKELVGYKTVYYPGKRLGLKVGDKTINHPNVNIVDNKIIEWAYPIGDRNFEEFGRCSEYEKQKDMCKETDIIQLVTLK